MTERGDIGGPSSYCGKSPDEVHCLHWFEDKACCWCRDRACDLEVVEPA